MTTAPAPAPTPVTFALPRGWDTRRDAIALRLLAVESGVHHA